MTTPVSPRSTSAQLASASGLFQTIQAKASFLCVGLDPDPAKIPAAFGTGVAAMEAFCSAVVEATLPYAVAYKPNFFFEQWPKDGCLSGSWPRPSDVLVIADKREHGNTALKYAQALFTALGADAVTVAHMGRTAWSLSRLSSTNGPCCWRSHSTPARISSSTAGRRLKTCWPNPKRLKGPTDDVRWGHAA